MPGPSYHGRTHGEGGTDPIPRPDVVDSIDGGAGGPLTGDVTFSGGTGITLTQAGQNIEVAADPISRVMPRFMYATRTDDVGPSAAWAPTGAWTITTNDASYPSVTNPVGNWRGLTFNVSTNTLGFNLDAPTGVLQAQAAAAISAWSAAAPSTVAFGVSAKPGFSLGSFSFPGVYAYLNDGLGALKATGPQRPVITTGLTPVGPYVYTDSRWQALKYTTLGADADITPTALQDSSRTATVTVQVLFVHLADWETP